MKKQKEQEYVKLPMFGIPKLIPYMRPYGRILLIMILCGLGGSATDVLLPFFQKYALNHFVELGTLDTLIPFILLYLAFLVVQMAVNFISTYFAARIEHSVSRDLRRAAFNHLQTLSFSYFNQNSVGYIHARVMSDTSRIGEMVSWSLMDGVWHISYIVGVIAVMFSMNPRLALLVVAVIPFTVICIWIFQSKLSDFHRKIREINSRITGNFNEGITGAKTVKTLVIEEKMSRDFNVDSAEMKRTSIRASRLNAMFGSVITFASSLVLALVLLRGGKLTMENAMLIGTLSVFMSYALGVMEPIRWLIDALSTLINVQVNIERFTKLMETKSDVADSAEVVKKYGDSFEPKRENWEELHGDIEFCDVTFKYPDGEEYILEHFDLKLPRGSSVAIVGETGAGKSTLVNLVCRFFEPTEGRVLIDGRDARERSQLWLHSNIGYVLQTPHLFSGTVAENLRYGNPNATEEEIMAALKRVSADDIVAKMEKGLESQVGEGGDLLSTGEKQLLSFARAILADPRILALDEATASVDTITEGKIQSAIKEITNGRTSLVIAHRLSTIRNSDLILVVSAGKIIERGTHTELMKARGHYYSLYTKQFEEEATKALLQ
ncbi:MAG: ABC transporter ATP-binding protein [Ruminococcaceae bacterium]|nr:ABC transporter ATP-binding protein [Oscillospiraceae bacterium]